ncbi:MAG: tyrosine-type recombinase/integrase [Phocaeicola sp.]
MMKDSFLCYLRFEKNYSERTIVSYGIDLEKFEAYFKEVDEAIDFSSIDASIVRGWMVSLMNMGYTATSVNRKLSTLRSFYRYLLREKRVLVNPVAKVVGPKKKKPLPVFLKEEDMNRLLDDTVYADGFIGSRDRLIIEMFYATGIRLSELVGLKDADIDFSASLIKVTGKRNRQRLIPFGEELRNSMQDYLVKRKEAGYGAVGSFFILDNGKEIYAGKIYQLVKQSLSKVVTLKKRSPHVLRHTFATSMLNNQATLSAVKELLGHQSLSATEVYTHTTFEELKKVYELAHPRA